MHKNDHETMVNISADYDEGQSGQDLFWATCVLAFGVPFLLSLGLVLLGWFGLVLGFMIYGVWALIRGDEWAVFILSLFGMLSLAGWSETAAYWLKVCRSLRRAWADRQAALRAFAQR